jgi:hydrogenase maturation protease
MNVLVLGIGNILMQDEGAGVRALEAFEDRFCVPEGVELLDGGTSGLQLLQELEGRDALVVLDVVRGGRPPGSLTRLTGDEVPALLRQKISPHQLGLADLLATARLSGSVPKRLVLLGIEPKTVETGLELSAEVQAGLAGLSDLLAEELAALSSVTDFATPPSPCGGGSG